MNDMSKSEAKRSLLSAGVWTIFITGFVVFALFITFLVVIFMLNIGHG